MDRAFELLEQMKQSSNVQPDEITYNTLLDGCARFGLWDRGLQLLQTMQEAGMPPSNFTLSVVAKLANRCKRAREAFRLVEELSSKYRIRPNVHVLNNLIQACTLLGDLPRGLQVFEQLLSDKQ